MGKNQHVTYNGDNGWNIMGEGNSKITKVFSIKQEAIEYGKRIAKNQKSELFIHGLDGKIQDKYSYLAPKNKVN